MSLHRAYRYLPPALMFLTLSVAWGQTDDATLTVLEKNLPTVKAFEYGQNQQPLVEIEQAVFQLPPNSKIRDAVEQQLIEALATAETADAKAFLCSQLRVIGTAKCIPSLAKLLTDPENSSSAIYALGRLEVPAASEALHHAIGTTTGAVQAGLINALADRGYQQAQPDLLQILQSTDSDVVRRACTRALGRLGGRDTVTVLLGVCRDENADVAREAQNAVLHAAEALAAHDDSASAATAYRELLELPLSPQCNLAAIRGLVIAEPEKAPQLLAARITGNDARVARDAIALITLVPGHAATERFAGLTDKLNLENQVLLLRALGKRSDVAASPTLIAAAEHEDEQVRLAALEALGSAGDVTALPTLLKAASSGGAVALVARRSLAQLTGDEVDNKLKQLLAGDNPLAVEAVRAVAARGTAEVVPQLMELATVNDDTLRQAAITALGQLAESAGFGKLVLLIVTSTHPEDKEVLVEAAGQVLAKQLRTNRDPVPLLLNALDRAPIASKPMLLRLLGKTGSSEALAAIRTAVASKDRAFEKAAVQALAQWPDARASHDLLQLIRGARTQELKELALQGYVRLANLSDDPTALFVTVLQQVDRVGDRKLVLEGLGLNASTPEAMELALQYVDDAQLAPAAGLATLRIAHRLRDSHAKAARAALDRVVAEVDHEDVRRRALEVINDMQRFDDHILQWEGAGPFMEEGKDGAAIYQTAFAPENPDASDVKWEKVAKGIGSWDINLESTFGGYDHCAAYLRTRVWSPKQQEATMEMGSDDGVKAWFNDELVFDQWTQQAAAPRQHRVKVTLKQGWNKLMLKAVDFEGGWVVACRLRAADGSALEGLKVSVE